MNDGKHAEKHNRGESTSLGITLARGALILALGMSLIVISIAVLAPSCRAEEPTPAPSAGTAEPDGTSEPTAESTDPDAAGVATVVADRTPIPTPTLGPVQERMNEIVQEAGLSPTSFLGLTIADWINLAITSLIVALGYFIGVRLLFGLLKGVVRRTSTDFDDAFLESVGGELRRLVMIFVSRFAILRLGFLSDTARTTLDDIFFIVGLVVVLRIAFDLINFAVGWYEDRIERPEDQARLAPHTVLLQRLGYVLVFILGASAALNHFGVNITAFSAVIVGIGLVFALSGRDVVSDAISGFIIAIDQPFRVGDRIWINDLDAWGDIVDIGTRTTRIHTRDNREVLIPNSKMSQNTVVNYSNPDPSYRLQADIGVAYGSDFDTVRHVIQDAVHRVDGVKKDKQVDVLFLDFGDTSRTMRVRWWIDDYSEEKRVRDRVNSTLETALGKAGIDMPFTTYALKVTMTSGDEREIE